MTAFADVQKDPKNAQKYENNPKVQKVMEKLSATLGTAGMGGAKMGGAGPGGASADKPRPPPAAAAGSTNPPPSTAAEMDLD